MAMTSAVPAAAPVAAVRALLAQPSMLGRIRSMVRRRVPAQAVEDVVHQTACEALAAEDPPLDPLEARRWLYGIASHKIADFHRRARRAAVVHGLDPEVLASRPPALEARSLLRGVLADATRDPRGAETMGWIAREMQGERLESLAREAGLPPATVRQRVSRMRRWLRVRWGREALMLVAASILTLLLALRPQGAPPVEPIYADPAGNTSAAAIIALQGRWHLVSLSPDMAMWGPSQAMLEGLGRSMRIEVVGDVLQLQLDRTARTVSSPCVVGPVVDGRFEVRFPLGAGSPQVPQVAVAHFDPSGRLVVVGTQGQWRGTVVLER
jgi:DNA-directed RNA polymerase specialized sigma24 family protein